MSSKKPVFKESFKKYFGNLIGDELPVFIKACETPLLDSIRTNTIKINSKSLKSMLEAKGWVLKSVPFYDDAFIVEKRDESLGNTIEHFMGYYYVQEQSSMIPPLVLDPKPGELVLDCCASPGSKTGQLSQLMDNKGVIVANDKGLPRIMILQTNLQRCGCRNVVIINGPGQRLGRMNEFFDKVLVDAPCSGFGAIRKDWTITKMFNPKAFGFLKRVQSELLETGWKSLKPKGCLVYSTCTLTTEENEDVVNDFLNNHSDAVLERIKLKGLNNCEGISMKEAVRIWPHRVDMEGFFVARLVKK
ncbi:MAG: RsmB/NOP family class I SAM-dependent RNA methyltransferase [Nanoarchaeota archaeon]|nr:RsmB/NOP family class I SAM-dependent RNA methyltransferase [Nanoarchaeota archaeon]